MKKTIVAVAVAALAATSANAATVYNQDGTKLEINGSARVVLTKQTANRADLQDDGSRVKFKFSQQLGEGFSALGYYELRTGDLDGKDEIDPKTGEIKEGGIHSKYIYAGFAQEDIGTLTFGKRHTAADNFKLADPTENFDSVLDGRKGETEVNTSADKVINFESANFAGFGFETSYVFDNNSKDDDVKNENDNAYQILAKYENDFDGVAVATHALYSNQKLNNGKDRTKSWGLGAAVEVAGFGFAADYVDSRLDILFGNEPKTKSWQIATTYQVNEPMDVYMAYHQFKHDFDIAGKGDEKVKGFAIGSHYKLADNVETYVEYTTDKLEDNKRDNKYYAGLRVFF